MNGACQRANSIGFKSAKKSRFRSNQQFQPSAILVWLYTTSLLFSASMYVREWQTRQTNGVHRSVCVYEPRERARTQPDECEWMCMSAGLLHVVSGCTVCLEQWGDRVSIASALAVCRRIVASRLPLFFVQIACRFIRITALIYLQSTEHIHKHRLCVCALWMCLHKCLVSVWCAHEMVSLSLSVCLRLQFAWYVFFLFFIGHIQLVRTIIRIRNFSQ